MPDSPSTNSGGQSLDAQPTPGTPPLDILLDTLANQRRRYTLHCLCESATPIALADLAKDVTRREQETPLPEIPPEEIKQVYMSLYHVHLPKLVAADIVERIPERNLVTLATEKSQIEPFVEFETPSK